MKLNHLKKNGEQKRKLPIKKKFNQKKSVLYITHKRGLRKILAFQRGNDGEILKIFLSCPFVKQWRKIGEKESKITGKSGKNHWERDQRIKGETGK